MSLSNLGKFVFKYSFKNEIFDSYSRDLTLPNGVGVSNMKESDSLSHPMTTSPILSLMI